MHTAPVCVGAVCISVGAGVCADLGGSCACVSVCLGTCVPVIASVPCCLGTQLQQPHTHQTFNCLKQETCIFLGRKVGQSFRERI